MNSARPDPSNNWNRAPIATPHVAAGSHPTSEASGGGRILGEITREPRLANIMAAEVTAEACPAHDLACFLAAFDRNLDLLASDWLSPESSDAVGSLRALTLYLKRMSVALRAAAADFGARAAIRRMDLATWWPDMGALLRAVHGDGVTVRADIPHDLPPVGIEPARLTHVVLCLVTVAARAPAPPASCEACEPETESEADSGEIEFSARLAGHSRAVILNITDRGACPTPPGPARAYTPFFTAAEDGNGIGLGVPTVNRLIADVGGRVQFSSAAGRGTTAAIELPITADHEPALQAVSSR